MRIVVPDFTSYNEFSKYNRKMLATYCRSRKPREEVEERIEKILKRLELDLNDVDSVAEYFHLYSTLDDARYVLEKSKINEDKDKFNEFLDLANKYHPSMSFFIDRVKKVLGLRFYEEEDINNIINLIIDEKTYIDYNYSIGFDKTYMDDVYYNAVSDHMRSDVDFINKLLAKFPQSFPFIYKYIDKKDMHKILDKYYRQIYPSGKNVLSEEELNYISNRVKVIDGKPIYVLIDDSLVSKLRKRCNKKYTEYAKEKGIDPDDDVTFMRTVLNSNVLRTIYSNGDFTNDDMTSVRNTINSFEAVGEDCSKFRELEKKYKREVATREVGICNYLVSYKDNPEKIDELLAELKVTKDNYFTYIKERKFLDKPLKESALLILGKHFKTNTISVYDIIEMLQEMEDRELTLDEILIDRNINKTIFYNIYDRFKEENPEMFQFIQEALSKNQIRGFKKLLKLYYSIINSGINKYDDFVEKYEKTPEEILEMFSSIDDLYDNLNKYISSWYNVDDTKEEKKTSKR